MSRQHPLHHLRTVAALLLLVVGLVAPAGALAAGSPTTHQSSTSRPPAATPEDPYIPCGGYPFSDPYWQWCDAGYGPYFLQGQIGPLHVDTTSGWHYNLEIQSAGGQKLYYNWHITYCGSGNNYYMFQAYDTVTMTIDQVTQPWEGSQSKTAQYAASTFAYDFANDIGDPNLNNALMALDVYGDQGDLPLALKSLMGLPTGSCIA